MYGDTIKKIGAGSGRATCKRNHNAERQGVLKCIANVQQTLKRNNIKIPQDCLDDTLKTMNAAIGDSADIAEYLGCLSDCIKIINTLGYGGATTPKEKVKGIKDSTGATIVAREVEIVSSIVGYKIQNISDKVIKYPTELFTYNEETKRYEGTREIKSLQPGEIAQISKFNLNLLSFMPEFGCKFANGKIICRGMYKPDEADLDNNLATKLNKFYFVFSDKNRVHDVANGIKLSIAKAIYDDNNRIKDWFVEPEYVEVFGNLNNKKNLTYRVNSDKKGFDNARDMARYMRETEAGGVF